MPSIFILLPPFLLSFLLSFLSPSFIHEYSFLLFVPDCSISFLSTNFFVPLYRKRLFGNEPFCRALSPNRRERLLNDSKSLVFPLLAQIKRMITLFIADVYSFQYIFIQKRALSKALTRQDQASVSAPYASNAGEIRISSYFCPKTDPSSKSQYLPATCTLTPRSMHFNVYHLPAMRTFLVLGKSVLLLRENVEEIKETTIHCMAVQVIETYFRQNRQYFVLLICNFRHRPAKIAIHNA